MKGVLTNGRVLSSLYLILNQKKFLTLEHPWMKESLPSHFPLHTNTFNGYSEMDK